MAANKPLGEIIKQAWETVKGDLVFFIVGFLVVGLVGGMTFGILSGPLMVGFIMAIFKKLDGQSVVIGDIFNLGFSKFLPGFLAMLLLGIAYGIGLMLLIIPGILVAIFGAFTLHFIADKDLDAIAAIKASFALVKANFGSTFVTLLVAGLIGGAGAIVCYIGMFVTAPIALVMITLAYKDLSGGSAAASPAPATPEA